MPKVKRITTITAALIAAMSMTWADDASAMNGDKLRSLCSTVGLNHSKTNEEFSDVSECVGYIHAVVDAQIAHCMPRGVTVGIAIKVVLAYLNSHPEMLHMKAFLLVENALEQAYPCPPKPNGKDGGR